VNCIVGGVLFPQLITCVPVGGGAPMRGEAAGSAAATMRGGGAGRPTAGRAADSTGGGWLLEPSGRSIATLRWMKGA
jgi:hypothetical protein